MLEAEAVVHLSFQFAVAEAVPLLEGEELHHGHGVDVGSASSCALVVVEALDDGSEGLPVYEEVDVGEPVAIFLDVIVGFSEHVVSKGVHVSCLVIVVYKFNRGARSRENRGKSKSSKEILEAIGIGDERLDVFFISSAMAPKFVEVIKEVTEKLRKLGPALPKKYI